MAEAETTRSCTHGGQRWPMADPVTGILRTAGCAGSTASVAALLAQGTPRTHLCPGPAGGPTQPRTLAKPGLRGCQEPTPLPKTLAASRGPCGCQGPMQLPLAAAVAKAPLRPISSRAVSCTYQEWEGCQSQKPLEHERNPSYRTYCCNATQEWQTAESLASTHALGCPHSRCMPQPRRPAFDALCCPTPLWGHECPCVSVQRLRLLAGP
eukprot:358582-Chlamydomonas_euryale.AAC.14